MLVWVLEAPEIPVAAVHAAEITTIGQGHFVLDKVQHFSSARPGPDIDQPLVRDVPGPEPGITTPYIAFPYVGICGNKADEVRSTALFIGLR